MVNVLLSGDYHPPHLRIGRLRYSKSSLLPVVRVTNSDTRCLSHWLLVRRAMQDSIKEYVDGQLISVRDRMESAKVNENEGGMQVLWM